MKRVRRTNNRARKRLGFLAFEWILLISLLVIGIIGGLSAVRNALICELSELAESITALNVSGDDHGDNHPPCDHDDPDGGPPFGYGQGHGPGHGGWWKK